MLLGGQLFSFDSINLYFLMLVNQIDQNLPPFFKSCRIDVSLTVNDLPEVLVFVEKETLLILQDHFCQGDFFISECQFCDNLFVSGYVNVRLIGQRFKHFRPLSLQNELLVKALTITFNKTSFFQKTLVCLMQALTFEKITDHVQNLVKVHNNNY